MKKLLYVLFCTIGFITPIYAKSQELPQYPYVIEYYYDNRLDTKETIQLWAAMGDLITQYPEKNKEGYDLFYSTIDDEGLTISQEPDFNIIKVFYHKIDSENNPKVPKTGIETGANILLPSVMIIGLLLAKEKLKR